MHAEFNFLDRMQKNVAAEKALYNLVGEVFFNKLLSLTQVRSACWLFNRPIGGPHVIRVRMLPHAERSGAHLQLALRS